MLGDCPPVLSAGGRWPRSLRRRLPTANANSSAAGTRFEAMLKATGVGLYGVGSDLGNGLDRPTHRGRGRLRRRRGGYPPGYERPRPPFWRVAPKYRTSAAPLFCAESGVRFSGGSANSRRIWSRSASSLSCLSAVSRIFRVMRGFFKGLLQALQHSQIAWPSGSLLAFDNISQGRGRRAVNPRRLQALHACEVLRKNARHQ